MEKDRCRLCGTFDQISFEHIPPKACYNSITRYTKVPFLDYIKKADCGNNSEKLKIEQGGVGFYSLCKSCNNTLGINYVKAYTVFVKCLAIIISRNANNYFLVEIKDLELLKILKQIISMFLSINNYEFSRTFKELTNFVNQIGSNFLPDRFRIFCYLNSEGSFRHLPFSIKGNFYGKPSIACSELCFPPIGLVLTVDYTAEMINGLTEITHFKNASANSKNDVELGIYKLPTITPFLLDYRSKEQVEYEKAKSVPEPPANN